MAPKRQQKKGGASKPAQSGNKRGGSGPKMELSAENQRRIRQLLLNSGQLSLPSSTAPAEPSMSRTQKAKKLRTIYDQLSCEGFRPDHIESALSALKDGATFEAALDWLCLHVPGTDLPLKFSSGKSASLYVEGSVHVLSTACDEWVPSRDRSVDIAEASVVPFKVRGRHGDDDEILFQPSDADWIRQYVKQQEEDEDALLEADANQDSLAEVTDPSCRAASIAKEFENARLAALEAKSKGDKEKQERAGQLIRKLKHEISSLGLSDLIYEVNTRTDDTSSSKFESKSCETAPCEDAELGKEYEGFFVSDFSPTKSEPFACVPEKKKYDMKNLDSAAIRFGTSISERELDKTLNAEVEQEDVDLSALFSDDTVSLEASWMPGKLPNCINETLAKDIAKMPKALLHQQCQKLGWEAPKYSKLSARENAYSYSVSVLCKTTGRGKNRKAGGLVKFEFPDQEIIFNSVEDAQNGVATFALYNLFPELPFIQLFSEPYVSFLLQWFQGKGLNRMEDENNRREGFVNSLLGEVGSSSLSQALDVDLSLDESSPRESDQINADSGTLEFGRINSCRQVDSSLLKNRFKEKRKNSKYKKMQETRSGLPIAELRPHFLQLLKENDVLVVCGETGCGKTTQIPQFILEDMIQAGAGGLCNIICTQPRRIAAISVAERVANELCEPFPGSKDSLVGYQVRLENARSDQTKLLFCTTGILLRKLIGDKLLSDVTHVIVDEVHERTLLGDFLLIVLKDLIKKRSSSQTPKLKVILMSATADASLFSKYFGCCPVITAKGRTHHVTTYFLEDIYESLNYHLPSDSPASISAMAYERKEYDSKALEFHKGKKNAMPSSWGDETLLVEGCINPHYHASLYQTYSERTQQNLKTLNEDVIDFDLLEELIYHIDEEYPAGAVLIFLPGLTDISMLLNKLTASYHFGGSSSDWLIPLHSSLSSIDQQKVFLSPPDGIRKVIIATNIAETSITIDDVVYVIDCGKHKENHFNPKKKMSSMVEEWISQASAKQRCGRAGRVKPGVCFRLYTCHRFEQYMRQYQVPEILRKSLVELCLQIKSLSLGDIKSFLAKAIEPPREEAVTAAIAMLYEVGALEGNEKLTPLGHHLAKLPVDVKIGKMMLYSGIFGCLSPILSISAFFSYKSPFLFNKDEKLNIEKAKLSILTDERDYGTHLDEGYRHSDHLLLAIAYDKWFKILAEKGEKAARAFCNTSFLSSSVMYTIRDMRIQFGSLLADIGLITFPKMDGRMKGKLDSWLSDFSQPFNLYARYSSLLKAVLCAGLYPNVAATEEGMTVVSHAASGQPLFSPSTNLHWFDSDREVHLHPSSINANSKGFQYPFLVFLEKVETSKVFLRDTSIVSPYSIMLFGGSVSVQHQAGYVTVDGWLKLSASAEIAVLLKELRFTLHSVLKQLILRPERAANIVQNEVVKSIVQLLMEEDTPKLRA